MMNNVIEFPSRHNLNTSDLEKALRESLKSSGYNERAIERAVNKAMPLIQEARQVTCKNIKISLNSSIPSQDLEDVEMGLSGELQKYQKDIGDFVLRLIIDIALAEAQQY